jgi:hypothetical protein
MAAMVRRPLAPQVRRPDRTGDAKHSRILVETIVGCEESESTSIARGSPVRRMQELDSRNVRRGCAVRIGPGGISEVELQPAAEKWVFNMEMNGVSANNWRRVSVGRLKEGQDERQTTDAR